MVLRSASVHQRESGALPYGCKLIKKNKEYTIKLMNLKTNRILGLVDPCRGIITTGPNRWTPLLFKGLKTMTLDSSYGGCGGVHPLLRIARSSGAIKTRGSRSGIYKSFFEIKPYKDLPNSQLFHCRAVKTQHPIYLANEIASNVSPADTDFEKGLNRKSIDYLNNQFKNIIRICI
uniref:Uncharacterized protein n=1 Tax=Wolfiporia cocos TaxID=81056 RepID=A0A7G7YDR4_9APHY|nr:hypothetical protein [Wolfiporia cocos]QNH92634.1 hypothetical protein [Wolfiporia cocos]